MSLRDLPPVDALAAQVDAPRQVALAALEATLRAHRDNGDVPVLAMLRGDGLDERARKLAQLIPGAEPVAKGVRHL